MAARKLRRKQISALSGTLNKVTAAAVISRLRISNNGELKEIEGLCSKITPLDIEEGVKGKSQQLEKSLRP